MSTTRPSRSPVSTEPTGWTGWVAFAATMMILLGSFQAIQGFVAIFDDGYYRVTESGLVLEVDFTVWGWTHLLLGVLIFASGMGLLTGNVIARTVAVVLAALSLILNLMFMEAHPIWSTVIITIDVLVIYAVTVHGRESIRA